MASFKEGALLFSFPAECVVSKYDEWTFYKNQFRDCCGGNKGVDFVAMTSDSPNEDTLWLIEVKDYRLYARSKDEPLEEEVAKKVRDSLAGLLTAAFNASHGEFVEANTLIKAKRIKIVLHLEIPPPGSKGNVFPKSYAVNVQQKLRLLVKPIDAHPQVVSISNMVGKSWTVVNKYDP